MLTPDHQTISQTRDLGNYFSSQTYTGSVLNAETVTPRLLTKLIRSGTNQNELLTAANAAQKVTEENLCDALDREISLPVFQVLIDKVENIGESVLSCAIYQGRTDELKAMLKSQKVSVPLTSLLPKVKSKRVLEAILDSCPDIKAM